jgi:hypothetical protein
MANATAPQLEREPIRGGLLIRSSSFRWLSDDRFLRLTKLGI